MTTGMTLKEKLTPRYAFRLHHDPDAENYRLDAPVARIICWHRRHLIGDRHEFAGPDEFLASLESAEIYRPLYMLDHSAVALSIKGFSDTWDSGQVGFVAVTPTRLRETGIDPSDADAVTALLRSEIAMEQRYVNGEYYRIAVHRHVEEGIIESPLTVIAVGDAYEDEDLDECVAEWLESRGDDGESDVEHALAVSWTK